VISPRAQGLSVGVNMNPDLRCNFDCLYCEVNRSGPTRGSHLNVAAMAAELEQTLERIHSGRLRDRPCYRNLPDDLLQLRHVALSGDGEPTLCAKFTEAVEAVIHLRARGRFPGFKLVLITNARGLDRPEIAEGLRLFTPNDEVWAKLESGTQAYMDQVNRPDCTLEQIVANILELARRRPVIIQSLFLSIAGRPPPEPEVEAYVQRLRELKDAGAQIPLVQVYSATRPIARPDCGHLSLRALSHIASRVRAGCGLRAEVY
jgi:wyosine [tRNA(Phe)-imidazoG37] synthetase (radical SAM superfamily)